MKQLFCILLFGLLFLDFVTPIKINEIMYNPEGNDNNKEFIEIFYEEYIDLTNYLIADDSSNDTLVLLNYFNSSYALIVEKRFNYSNINASVYSVGATIGNNLGNSGDIISLYDSNNTLIASVTYDNTYANGNGYSLEFYDGKWYESIVVNGTPGKANSVKSHVTQDFSNLMITEFLPDPEGYDNAAMPDGEWIELYNKGNRELDLRKLYFKDSKNHKLYITDITTISTIIPAKGYLVVYRNGGSFSLNNKDFEEIQLYDYENNLITQIDYAESTEGVSWAYINDMWKGTKPSPGSENPYEELPEYYFDLLEIENLGSNNRAEFGQTLKVKLNAYKGDFSKNSMKLWVEDEDERISKITKLNIYSKFSNYTLIIPVQLYPNCNGKYKEGDYDVHVSWYSPTEIEDSLSFEVKGITDDLCDKIYVEKSPRKGTLDYKLVEAPVTIEVGKEFTVKIELTNNDGEDHLVDIRSYVYRGPKSYSPSKEANKKSVLVKSDQTKEFDLSNIVEKAKSGDYKLKIKIKRDDQKTEKEITREIKIINIEPESVSEIIETELEKPDNTAMDLILEKNYSEVANLYIPQRSEVIYESSNERIKKLIPYFITAMSTLLSAFLIIKKE